MNTINSMPHFFLARFHKITISNCYIKTW